MAKRAIPAATLTAEQMNSGESYRVLYSYGTFSLAVKVTQSGRYYYAMKRVRGQLHKVYVGKCGEITKDVLHKATMELKHKYDGYGRDHRGMQ